MFLMSRCLKCTCVSVCYSLVFHVMIGTCTQLNLEVWVYLVIHDDLTDRLSIFTLASVLSNLSITIKKCVSYVCTCHNLVVMLCNVFLLYLCYVGGLTVYRQSLSKLPFQLINFYYYCN